MASELSISILTASLPGIPWFFDVLTSTGTYLVPRERSRAFHSTNLALDFFRINLDAFMPLSAMGSWELSHSTSEITTLKNNCRVTSAIRLTAGFCRLWPLTQLPAALIYPYQQPINPFSAAEPVQRLFMMFCFRFPFLVIRFQFGRHFQSTVV
jgi:hypothetical protein